MKPLKKRWALSESDAHFICWSNCVKEKKGWKMLDKLLRTERWISSGGKIPTKLWNLWDGLRTFIVIQNQPYTIAVIIRRDNVWVQLKGPANAGWRDMEYPSYHLWLGRRWGWWDNRYQLPSQNGPPVTGRKASPGSSAITTGGDFLSHLCCWWLELQLPTISWEIPGDLVVVPGEGDILGREGH